jgi:hypothetical protein
LPLDRTASGRVDLGLRQRKGVGTERPPAVPDPGPRARTAPADRGQRVGICARERVGDRIAPCSFEHVYDMPEWTIFRMLDVRGEAMAVICASFEVTV